MNPRFWIRGVPNSLTRTASRPKRPRIWVAGSLNFDVIASAPRFPRTGETLRGSEFGFYPGGKGANQAVSARRQGAAVSMIGCVGQDDFGSNILRFLSKEGIDVTRVEQVKSLPTGFAVIVAAEEDNSVVYLDGANRALTPSRLEGLPVSGGDVLVSNLEIPEATVEHFFRIGKDRGAVTILNLTPLPTRPRLDLGLADVVVLNRTELDAYLEFLRKGRLARSPLRNRLMAVRASPSQVVIVTLGPEGAAFLARNKFAAVPGLPSQVVDVTGAGDCFVGCLAAELSRGATISSCISYATMGASLSVRRRGGGTSSPRAHDIRAAGGCRSVD